MSSLVWLGPRSMELQESAPPSPADDEVRLSVQAVGICGSELTGPRPYSVKIVLRPSGANWRQES